jgi:cytoskeletal protein RodZ
MSNPAGPSAPQPYPTQPGTPPSYAPQPQPPKKKRTGLIILLVVVGLIGLLLFGSCVAILASLGEPSGTAVKEAVPEASAAASEEPTAPEPSEEPTTYTPKKSDWVLKIKTRDKQCFGSIGCNVEVRVTPYYAGPGSAEANLPDEGTVDITYRLTGDESGPITGTLVVDCADQTAESNDEFLSTRSSGTKIKATVTDIEYNEYG